MRRSINSTGMEWGDRRLASVLVILAVAVCGPAGAGTASALQSRAVAKQAAAASVIPPLEDSRLDAIEHAAIEHINEERRAVGVDNLIVCPELSVVARQYCRDMVERRYFAHLDPDGKMVYDRAARGGVADWTNIAENIARNRGFDDPATVAVREWMKSEGHRDNILNARFVETGLGAWVGADRTVYFAQIFIRRSPKR